MGEPDLPSHAMPGTMQRDSGQKCGVVAVIALVTVVVMMIVVVVVVTVPPLAVSQ